MFTNQIQTSVIHNKKYARFIFSVSINMKIIGYAIENVWNILALILKSNCKDFRFYRQIL